MSAVGVPRFNSHLNEGRLPGFVSLRAAGQQSANFDRRLNYHETSRSSFWPLKAEGQEAWETPPTIRGRIAAPPGMPVGSLERRDLSTTAQEARFSQVERSRRASYATVLALSVPELSIVQPNGSGACRV